MCVWIYALIDPRDGRTYYIGQTKDLEQRYAAHVTGQVASDRYVPWHMSMRNGLVSPDLFVIECTTVEMAREREYFWIDWAIQQGYKLVNSHGVRRVSAERLAS